MDKPTAALVAAYLVSIAAAAYAVTHVGAPPPFPGGPHTLPVWPGIAAPSGVYIVGVTLVIRDLLQHRVRKLAMVALILAGAGLAAIFSPAVAVASALAFAVSESIDYGVFTLAEPRAGRYGAILASNAVSLVVDSVVFLAVAFGSLAFIEGQIVGKTWATLAAVAVIWAVNRSRQVVTA